MKKIFSTLTLLSLFLIPSLESRQRQVQQASLNPKPTLSDFDYQSASVLPTYFERGTKYAILSREKYGRDKGKYDDFSGKRDEGEGHPVITASREFHEEAVIEDTIGLSLGETRDYIDIYTSKNTQFIIANTTARGAKNVTYITSFKKYKNQFIKNFYSAVKNATKPENREKDRIALVKWNDLRQAIVDQPHSKAPVYVHACVINPDTNEHENECILLRPYLAIKLRPFFCNEKYTEGKSRKIRFYDKQPVTAVHSSEESLEQPVPSYEAAPHSISQ